MNFTSGEMDYIKENEAYRPIPECDKRRIESVDTFDAAIRQARADAAAGSATGMPDMRHCIIKGIDLAGRDLSGIDFRRATFDGCNLHGTDFSDSQMDNVAFYNNDLTDMKLCGCKARGCSFRFQDRHRSQRSQYLFLRT